MSYSRYGRPPVAQNPERMVQEEGTNRCSSAALPHESIWTIASVGRVAASAATLSTLAMGQGCSWGKGTASWRGFFNGLLVSCLLSSRNNSGPSKALSTTTNGPALVHWGNI